MKFMKKLVLREVIGEKHIKNDSSIVSRRNIGRKCSICDK